MEPGHEDREYVPVNHIVIDFDLPQWSPVMKTGNTSAAGIGAAVAGLPQWSPVMKTGNTPRRRGQRAH